MKNFLNFTVNTLLKRHSFSSSKNTLDFKNQKIRFLCTISSGQDSTVTLFLLMHKDKKESFQLLYCNHFWQIKNFFSARSLYKVSYLSNISYTFILPENKFLTENESREWRKKSFYRFSQVENMSFLVTGHTQTDTVEKNLTTVVRGTSPGACSKSSILNYRKTVDSFFSSITNTSFSLINLEKTKTPSLSFCSFRSQVQIQKSISVLLKPKKSNKKKTTFLPQNSNFETKKKNLIFKISPVPKNVFLGPTSFLESNKSWNQTNQILCKWSKFKKQPKIKYFFSKKESKQRIGPVQPRFYFFPNKTYLIKKKNENKFSFSTETISSSFCLSNDFFKLEITFLKPLDNISRLTISKFFYLYNVPLISDITNFSSAFSRNKIRHQLIPFCKLLVNSNVESLLINFFKLLSDENTSHIKKYQQLEFFYKIRILQTFPQKNYFCNELTKTLEAHFFSNEKRSLVQKLFFDYKNINLKFFQIKKLETFY